MSKVEKTLKERAKNYGDSFLEQAKISQSIKKIMRESPQWEIMQDDQKESLEMIATKLSRLLYGNCNHVDSYHDIAGYSALIENRITEKRGK